LSTRLRYTVAAGLLIFASGAMWLGRFHPAKSPPDGGMLCGHVCALRLCQLRGAVVSAERVKAEMPSSAGTHSLLDIAQFLQKQQIPTEGLRVGVDELDGTSFPCVAALNNPPHFVVLIQKDESVIHLFDFDGERIVVPIPIIKNRWGNAILIGKERPNLPGDRGRDEPCIRVDALYKDIGWVSKLSLPRDVEFNVQNAGNSQLIISDLMVTCSCLDAKLDSTELKPGETTKLKLKYRPDSRTGRFEQSVVVTSNDPEQPVLRLTTAGIAANGLVVNPEVVRFHLDPKTGEIPAQFVFLTHPDHYTSFHVLRASVSSKNLSVREVEWNESQKEEWYSRLGSVGSVPDDQVSGRNFRVLRLSPIDQEALSSGDTATLEIETDVERFEHLAIPVTIANVTLLRAFPPVIEFDAGLPGDLSRNLIGSVQFGGPAEICRLAGVGDGQEMPESLAILSQKRVNNGLLRVDIVVSPEDALLLSGSTISLEFNAGTKVFPIKLDVLLSSDVSHASYGDSP